MKHKSIQTNNERKLIPETVVYHNKTKFGAMLPVKWQKSTASNQNHIDGLCKNKCTKYSQTTISTTNSRRAFFKKKRKTYKEHQVANIIF
ncbi:hypothetical protein V1478_005675 [Vespula squamosa]|uniref:Uncharacterized protein n=1 Tax=Vespula squamosa TaxID=30214 RepID=A0ABD2B9M0_VESSQ